MESPPLCPSRDQESRLASVFREIPSSSIQGPSLFYNCFCSGGWLPFPTDFSFFAQFSPLDAFFSLPVRWGNRPFPRFFVFVSARLSDPASVLRVCRSFFLACYFLSAVFCLISAANCFPLGSFLNGDGPSFSAKSSLFWVVRLGLVRAAFPRRSIDGLSFLPIPLPPPKVTEFSLFFLSFLKRRSLSLFSPAQALPSTKSAFSFRTFPWSAARKGALCASFGRVRPFFSDGSIFRGMVIVFPGCLTRLPFFVAGPRRVRPHVILNLLKHHISLFLVVLRFFLLEYRAATVLPLLGFLFFPCPWYG